MRNTLLNTLLILSILIVSGCSHSPSATPLETVQKNFKSDFDTDALKEAIAKAAEKNDWDVLDQESQSINLKKTYSIKKRELSSLRTKHRYKPAVTNEIYVNVDVSNRSFTIKPSQGYEQTFRHDCDKKLFNKELGNLEDAINLELVSYL